MPVINMNQNQSRASEIKARMVELDAIEPILSHTYLVKGWLSQRGLSMLYGPSNAGKTFVALDIAMHVAACAPWRGCKVNGGPVLYIAAEGGVGVRNRLAALKLNRPELATAPFTLLPIGLDLHGHGDAAAVLEALGGTAPVFVVVDTLARSMGAGDENTAKDAAMFVKNCDLIREATQAHLMVVHHTGKDEERGARGSSALRAAVDTEINVTSEGGIICKKQRDMVYSDPLYFGLSPVALGQDEDNETVTSAVVIPKDRPKKKHKPLTGKCEVAIQALNDALRDCGVRKYGGEFPHNRKVVHIDHWRNACNIYGLTSGVSENAGRMAFTRTKDKLMELDAVRVWGDYVWRVQDDD